MAHPDDDDDDDVANVVDPHVVAVAFCCNVPNNETL
jgi:hypothetical protein